MENVSSGEYLHMSESGITGVLSEDEPILHPDSTPHASYRVGSQTLIKRL